MDGTPVKDLIQAAEGALRDFHVRWQEAESAAGRLSDAVRDLLASVQSSESS